MYYSEKLGWIGLQGVKVRARRWFTTHTGIVNSSGNYLCDGRFKRPANYSFSFERAHFNVVDQNQFNIWIDGPKIIGKWNRHFSRSANPLEYFYATVFRAAFHYCNTDIEDLNRPPRSEGLRSKIKLRCFNETNDVYGRFIRGTIIFSSKHIRIYNPQHRCDYIYATAIHELAHSAHWRQDRSFYEDKVADIVQESWATGVERYLTQKVYPAYEPDYRRGNYTGIVEDLVDGVGVLKESFRYKDEDAYLYKTYTDNVTGYTIKQIENALTGAETFEDWKNNLKSKYPNNETKENLDAAFAYWSSR